LPASAVRSHRPIFTAPRSSSIAKSHWGERIKQFDAIIETEQTSLPFPIRTIMLGDERAAISAARQLLDRGLYTSAIFFPTVAQGRAGLRVCPTASHLVEEVDWLGRELRLIIDGRAADGSGPRPC
jgi:7-keto-8-aminopelargonate synthetase-like enzyme